MRFIISMEGKSLKDELLKYFNFSVDTPTNSSFNQRCAQILPEAFEFLFREFTAIVSEEKLFRGYRLLACDGSDLCIAYNPQDETTYFQSTSNLKGFNQMHLNALYDLQSRTYVDAIIQPARQENENSAMCDMIADILGIPRRCLSPTEVMKITTSLLMSRKMGCSTSFAPRILPAMESFHHLKFNCQTIRNLSISLFPPHKQRNRLKK